MTARATPLPVVPWGRRFPQLAAVGSAALFAVAIERGRDPRAWCAAALATGVALAAARRIERVARAAGWGLALVVASLGVPSGTSRTLAAAGAIGAAVCVVAACRAIADAPPGKGLVTSEPQSPGAAIGVAIAAWWVALTAAVVPDEQGSAWMVGNPRAWQWAAIAASSMVVIGTFERWRLRHGLELGVAQRVGAMRALFATVFAGSTILALVASRHPVDVARLGLAAGATVIAEAALQGDALAAVRAARRIAVWVVFGGTVAIVGAFAVTDRIGSPWIVVLGTAAAALAIGSSASRIESPLRPARGAWLDAFARASSEAMHADPGEAIRGVLVALRSPLPLEAPSPELWTFGPSRVRTVDAAGYLHEREAEAPGELAPVAAGEPFGTLRAELLGALEVRRPEIRPLASWMAQRGALLATVVACDGEAEGVLVVARGRRRVPVTLEEVLAAKNVADRLALACRALGTEARLLARAQSATLRADAADQRFERLLKERALDAARNAVAAARMARPATIGIYGASSRMAVEALERQTSIGAPVAVVSPSGVDPAPYLARAHLAGSRRQGPLIWVDATSASEHDPVRWSDPHLSPLALADGGMLVLLDADAMPADVQRLIARACTDGRGPWDGGQGLDVQLAVTGIAVRDELATTARLDPALAACLGDAGRSPVVLPSLRDRPEDFRALLTDRLGREGLRVRGHPVGIENAAYLRLAEYSFPADDAELSSLVIRLVARCSGDTVRVSDLDRMPLPKPSGDLPPSRPRKDPLSA
jgi:hypothetical protein